MPDSNGGASNGRPHVPSIAICGGGITGLTLALNLIKLATSPSSPSPKYTVTIYESAPAFGEIGAGVSFGPNASHAMKCIGPEVYAAFEKTETRNQYPCKQDVWFDFRFGQSVDGRYKVDGEAGSRPEDRTGELIATVTCPGGQRGVKRSNFLNELIQHLPEGVARFGKRLTHYSPTTMSPEGSGGGVTLHFQDGTSAVHDALLGCDGIKSSVRRTLLQSTATPGAADAVFSGKYCYRGLIPMDEAAAVLGDEMAKNSQMYLGRHGHILTFAVEKGKAMNVVAFASAHEWTQANWVVAADDAQMRAAFAGWSSTATKIIGMMRNTDSWALFNHAPAATYVSGDGRVCVVGDAAHATTPHKGAGAGMAIEDAYVLGHLVAAALLLAAKHDGDTGRAIATALRVYDATRRPRTQRLVDDSRETGQLYDLERPGVGADKARVRDELLARMGWVWEHDVEAERAEAVKLLEERLAGTFEVPRYCA